MRQLLAILLFSVPLLAQSDTPPAAADVAAGEENVSGSVDLGYRWVSDVAGSMDTYRSVVNLNDGFRVLGLDLLVRDPNRKVFDKLTLFADSWGDPYNSLRVDAERNGNYRLLFDYRNIAYFSALPSFGNPQLDSGLLWSQRSFDLNRKMWNAELELRPGKRIVPFLAYSRDSGDGSGITPYVSTGNEYPIYTDYRDHSDNFRGGVRLEFNRWHLTLEQGGTTFKDDQIVSTDDTNTGNLTRPILGEDLFIDSARQGYGIRGSSLYSRGLFTANPARWVNLHAQFLFSQPKTDVNYNETADGLLYLGGANFAELSRGMGFGEATQPHTSASFSAELTPHDRVRIHESVMTDRLHNASSLLLDYAYQTGDSSSASSSFTPDRMVVNYSRQQADVFVDVTQKLTLRGGHRLEWGDAQVRYASLNPSQRPETGELRRNVGLAGVTFRPTRKVLLNADYEGSPGDKSYFTTSLHDYDKLRARTRFDIIETLEMNLGFLYFNNKNPMSTSGYEFRNVMGSASMRWRPDGGRKLGLFGEYSYGSVRSDIDVLVPPFYTEAASSYRDNAHTATVLVDINVPTVHKVELPKISVGGSLFRTAGSRPTTYYQPRARFLLPVNRHVSGFAEWRYYGMSETYYTFEGFRTHHLSLGVRLSP